MPFGTARDSRQSPLFISTTAFIPFVVLLLDQLAFAWQGTAVAFTTAGVWITAAALVSVCVLIFVSFEGLLVCRRRRALLLYGAERGFLRPPGRSGGLDDAGHVGRTAFMSTCDVSAQARASDGGNSPSKRLPAKPPLSTDAAAQATHEAVAGREAGLSWSAADIHLSGAERQWPVGCAMIHEGEGHFTEPVSVLELVRFFAGCPAARAYALLEGLYRLAKVVINAFAAVASIRLAARVWCAPSLFGSEAAGQSMLGGVVSGLSKATCPHVSTAADTVGTYAGSALATTVSALDATFLADSSAGVTASDWAHVLFSPARCVDLVLLCLLFTASARVWTYKARSTTHAFRVTLAYTALVVFAMVTVLIVSAGTRRAAAAGQHSDAAAGWSFTGIAAEADRMLRGAPGAPSGGASPVVEQAATFVSHCRDLSLRSYLRSTLPSALQWLVPQPADAGPGGVMCTLATVAMLMLGTVLHVTIDADSTLASFDVGTQSQRTASRGRYSAEFAHWQRRRLRLLLLLFFLLTMACGWAASRGAGGGTGELLVRQTMSTHFVESIMRFAHDSVASSTREGDTAAGGGLPFGTPAWWVLHLSAVLVALLPAAYIMPRFAENVAKGITRLQFGAAATPAATAPSPRWLRHWGCVTTALAPTPLSGAAVLAVNASPKPPALRVARGANMRAASVVALLPYFAITHKALRLGAATTVLGCACVFFVPAWLNLLSTNAVERLRVPARIDRWLRVSRQSQAVSLFAGVFTIFLSLALAV